MRWLILLGVFLLTPAAAQARDICKGDLCFQSKARTSCLKPQVWGILRTVAARVGPLEVTSGCDGRHARRSHHYSGRAVDFRPMRASSHSAIAVLRTLPQVGGVGSYSNGLVHADVGELRHSWHGQRSNNRRADARRPMLRRVTVR
jgi:uncharacterized protein YcbK (DUF882 family)